MADKSERIGHLVSLEIRDFKSYKGTVMIGPFKDFTAIIGPNGSGKSNLMDAICFVLGEKTTTLRVKKVAQLIHGSSVDKPVSTSCHVKMTYQHLGKNKTKKKDQQTFQRTVTVGTTGVGSSSYKIDGNTVNHSTYALEMAKINILIRAKNFLVYQGQVEAIAMKTPKERTILFEEMSKSGDLKADYDRLKVEMTAAEEELHHMQNMKRGVAAEKREARQEKDEAESYQKLKKTLEEKEVQLYLSQMYYVEEDMETKKTTIKTKGKERKEKQAEKTTADELVVDQARLFKKAQREVLKLDQQIQERENGYNTEGYIQKAENVNHQKDKLERQRRVLKAAEESAQAHGTAKEELQTKMAKLETESEKYSAQIAAESNEQSINLNGEQLDEYYVLKRKAGQKCAAKQNELDTVEREQHMDKSNLANEQRRTEEKEERAKVKQRERVTAERKMEQLKENIEQMEGNLVDEQRTIKTMEEEVTTNAGEEEECMKAYEEKSKELADAEGHQHESSQQIRKKDLIEKLQRLFPKRVIGRLVDNCEIPNNRHRVAVTKVLGKHMNAIVVDTEQTSRDCIAYMKEQQYESELFLPLDYIDVRPIDERLRLMTEPPGVKLVFDVILPRMPPIKRALQFGCGNTLLCETTEGARQLAYSGHERHKAVALDGTLFNTNGVISGGSSDLKNKAKRWEHAAVDRLTTEKAALREKITELHRSRRRDQEMMQKRNQLKTLETRINYMKHEKETSVAGHVTRLEGEISALGVEIESFKPRIAGLEKAIAKRAVEIEKLQTVKNSTSDTIFADFCVTLGIENIRVYEGRELLMHNEAKDKLDDFNKHIDRVRREIEYMESENKQESVKKSSALVDDMETELKRMEKAEKEERKKMKEHEEGVKKLRKQRHAKADSIKTDEVVLANAKKSAQGLGRELTLIDKHIAQLEQMLMGKKAERHSLLQYCQYNSVELPLTRDSLPLSDLAAFDESSASQQTSSDSGADTSQQSSQVTQKQHEQAAKIKVKYTSLDGAYKGLSTEKEQREAVDKLTKEVADTQAAVQRINAPNLKASDRLSGVKTREDTANKDHETARKKHHNAKKAFERVRNARMRAFEGMFNHVSATIDQIYKHLSRNSSSQAILNAENMEEPYLEGIQFNCVAPGKRFRPMDNLSGGEKTVAALALLFAIHAYHQSPFFVLDEIDAALDNTNIGKVVSYIQEASKTKMQVIVISLKEEFYNRADSLIGIYPQQGNCCISGQLTLDLTQYRDTDRSTR